MAWKFMKPGLDSNALHLYVPLIEMAVLQCIQKNPSFIHPVAQIRVADLVGEMVLLSAVSCLQGREACELFDNNLKEMYHDLEGGMTPINFVFPALPLPCNIWRDRAQRSLTSIYTKIIKARRSATVSAGSRQDHDEDLLSHLLQSTYKDGTPLPDKEIAHIMIAMVMGGQHSASATACWVLLRLASEPALVDELYSEQSVVIDTSCRSLRIEDIARLKLLRNVIKETFRVHPPLHSLLRKTLRPVVTTGDRWLIPSGRVMLASPAYTNGNRDVYPNPEQWNPHRWDRGNEYKHAEDSFSNQSSNLLPFGTGKHHCIGENFSYVQLMTIIAKIVRLFRIKNPPNKMGVPGVNYAVCHQKCSVTYPNANPLLVSLFPAYRAGRDHASTPQYDLIGSIRRMVHRLDKICLLLVICFVIVFDSTMEANVF